MLSSLWRQSLDIPSVKRVEHVSFDGFLASGSTLARDFVWDMDRTKSISVRNIRDWRVTSKDSTSSPLDGMVLERRTNLWKVVCLSETFTSPDDSMTAPFMMPVALGSHKSPCFIPAGDDMASSRLRSHLQCIHISPFAIPSTTADTRVSSATKRPAYLKSIFDTSVLWTFELEGHFVRCVPMDWSLGTAYDNLRPWWAAQETILVITVA
ncbi:hypothetical protein PHLGIDRAFT_428910 [Phlebiopsis gigantea 11061_1 CR5-6]|uniref:Uncharacterized protein n=1 Tax=Phlebiopsis gigantea (strain 11061_1 CR5-6) TaxID=745531 RepID=A0A0C3PL78_PHLG1|nr:hypothetical protein PHLGIDRAFT_428910 [Phlebiopsis gigantea 11061_1 CR5-6]